MKEAGRGFLFVTVCLPGDHVSRGRAWKGLEDQRRSGGTATCPVQSSPQSCWLCMMGEVIQLTWRAVRGQEDCPARKSQWRLAASLVGPRIKLGTLGRWIFSVTTPHPPAGQKPQAAPTFFRDFVSSSPTAAPFELLPHSNLFRLSAEPKVPGKWQYWPSLPSWDLLRTYQVWPLSSVPSLSTGRLGSSSARHTRGFLERQSRRGLVTHPFQQPKLTRRLLSGLPSHPQPKGASHSKLARGLLAKSSLWKLHPPWSRGRVVELLWLAGHGGQRASSPSILPAWAVLIALWESTWSHDELCVGRQAHLFPRPMSGDPCRAVLLTGQNEDRESFAGALPLFPPPFS